MTSILTLDFENNINFDFENYLENELKGTTNHKNNKNKLSLANGGDNVAGFSILPTAAIMTRKDLKRGTIVCRHWLRGLCMKGEKCEFLHQYDMMKMPECRWGMSCQVPECPFRHVPDEERLECAYYVQGFCVHGSNCRYRHIKLPKEECPEIADFYLQIKNMEDDRVKSTINNNVIVPTKPGSTITGSNNSVNQGSNEPPQNEFFKVAICKHWQKSGGSCPFGGECHFAHGKEELRRTDTNQTNNTTNFEKQSTSPSPPLTFIPPGPPRLPFHNGFPPPQNTMLLPPPPLPHPPPNFMLNHPFLPPPPPLPRHGMFPSRSLQQQQKEKISNNNNTNPIEFSKE